MNVAALLEDLHRRGIRVWADGERLRCNGPAGELTADVRDQLLERKHDILAFLRSAEALARPHPAIVPLQPRGSQIPIYGIGGHNGDVFCYRALARHLGEDQPFYGLQPPGLDGAREPLERIEDLADYFGTQIRAFHRGGPLILAGFCAGGTIAFELAQRLQRDGLSIPFVALFGAPFPARYRRWPMLREKIDEQLARAVKHARVLASLRIRDTQAYLARKLRERKARLAASAPTQPDAVLALRRKVERATIAAARRYTPSPFEGRIRIFVPSREYAQTCNDPLRWRSVAQASEEFFGPDGCQGYDMLREPYAAIFAEAFRACTLSLVSTRPARVTSVSPGCERATSRCV